MKNLAVLKYFTACFILAIILIFSSRTAQAYIYDDFTNPGIDASLWVDRGPNYGLFSQPGDGYLYFSDSIGAQYDRLRSFNQVDGAFFVAIKFSNFYAINNQGPNQGAGSAVLLRLGGNNYVDMMEFKNKSGLGFQANSLIDGTLTVVNYVHTNVTSGWLGIGYNGIIGAGGEVTFWYDFGAGWMLLGTCAPKFTEAPYFSIMGYNKYGTVTSFKVDQVQISPAPLPASKSLPAVLLLLGTSPLGLAGWKRFKKG
jgi:hypothetical protein